MKIYCDLIFEEIQEKDIDDLTLIMKRAFDEDTKIHLGREFGGRLVTTMVIFYANMHLIAHLQLINFQEMEKL